MAAHGNGEPDANLIAAAEAAASWARARRAAWTAAPLEVAPPSIPDEPLPPIEFETSPAAPPGPKPSPAPPAPAPVLRPAAPQPDPPPAARPAPPRPAVPSPPIVAAPSPPITIAPEPIAALPIAKAARPPAADAAPPPFIAATHPDLDDRPPRSSGQFKLIAAVAVVAAVVGGAVLGWPYLSNTLGTGGKTPQDDASFVGPKPEGPRATGALSVTSTPVGAQVLVDGKPRGVTPLTLKDVTPGKHDVVVKSNEGTVSRTVTVAANQTETIDEQIFSGWVTVYSPFEVTLAEGQRVLRPDERNQVLLSPGIHELRLINKTLSYEAVLQVDVKPGEGTNVRLTPAPSSLTVTASEPAEVLVDGVRAGQTPLNGFSVPLGTHEIVVRRANGSEKRYTATIGVKPYSLNVDF